MTIHSSHYFSLLHGWTVGAEVQYSGSPTWRCQGKQSCWREEKRPHASGFLYRVFIGGICQVLDSVLPSSPLIYPTLYLIKGKHYIYSTKSLSLNPKRWSNYIIKKQMRKVQVQPLYPSLRCRGINSQEQWELSLKTPSSELNKLSQKLAPGLQLTRHSKTWKS